MLINLEHGISNGQVLIRCNATVDDVIDVLVGNRRYIPAIYVFNKTDELSVDEIEIMKEMPDSIFVAAKFDWNREGLLYAIWQKLGLVRVYSKPSGENPDNIPFVLKDRSCTVETLCNKIHSTLLAQFKHALVWGKSVPHSPLMVGKDHVLMDCDVITVAKKI